MWQPLNDPSIAGELQSRGDPSITRELEYGGDPSITRELQIAEPRASPGSCNPQEKQALIRDAGSLAAS